jgi:uncharacterized protein YcsI (UPF0317 family)
MAVADGVAGAGTDWKQDLVSLSVFCSLTFIVLVGFKIVPVGG